jgi:hypothetical protein
MSSGFIGFGGDRGRDEERERERERAHLEGAGKTMTADEAI